MTQREINGEILAFRCGKLTECPEAKLIYLLCIKL